MKKVFVLVYFFTVCCFCNATVADSINTPKKLNFQFCYKNNGISSTLSIGGYGSLYEGSTINGLPIAPGTATITITSTPLPPITINNNDGTFTIAAGIFPQTINFNYSITCNGSTSASIDCELSISSTLYAIDDNVTFNANGSGTYNVLSNDMYLSDCINNTIITPTTSNVTVTQVGSSSNVYSIGSNGFISLIGIAVPGPYVLNYQICDIIYPSICQTATVTITIPSTFAPTTYPTTSTSKEIEHSNLGEIVISPNPTNNIVTINFNEAIPNNYKLELYDLLGRAIIEKQITKDSLQFELNLENYSSGNYIIRLSDDKNGFTFHKTITKL